MVKNINKRFFLLIAIGALLICAMGVAFWMIWYHTGYSKRGVVDNVTDIPYIGDAFRNFKVEGRVRYVCRFNQRGINCIFTGTTSPEDIETFCRPRDGWDMNLENGQTVRWPARYKYYGVKPENFPIGIANQDYYFSNHISNDNRYVNVEISFRSMDNRFTACVNRSYLQISFPSTGEPNNL